VTAIASNIHRFGPALRPREASREEVVASSPAVSAAWPFPEPVRPNVHWDELAWWTKQLGRPLDAA
jgi:hypothetical protein